MAKTKFRTNYDAPVMESRLSNYTKMTVPGQALTNAEHIKKARMGISDQTTKLIYDPKNMYPDVRAKDLVDQRTMIQGARAVVNDLREKGKQHENNMKLQKEAEKKKQETQSQSKIDEAIKQYELKKIQGGKQ